MKVLHTADWHLGQKFYHENRKKEHQAALDWLADYIIKEEIESVNIGRHTFQDHRKDTSVLQSHCIVQQCASPGGCSSLGTKASNDTYRLGSKSDMAHYCNYYPISSHVKKKHYICIK